MNLFVKYTVILIFGSVLISCGDGSHDHNTSHSEMQSNADHANKMDETSDLAIQLNNGDKWLVNDEMKPALEKGENALNDYLASNNNDYKSLAQELKSANSNLISSCTMDGVSHDELHKWLHPHLTLVGDLENAKTVNEADEVIEKLKSSYETYHTYFQ